MAEYIERKAANEALRECVRAYPNSFYGGIEVARTAIRNLPAADVAPVRHGRWVESSIPCEKYVCSECGGACWYYDYQGDVAKSRYCPNCGAKMDLEEADA